eukprot:758330-Hanusia_phi.AAC.4
MPVAGDGSVTPPAHESRRADLDGSTYHRELELPGPPSSTHAQICEPAQAEAAAHSMVAQKVLGVRNVSAAGIQDRQQQLRLHLCFALCLDLSPIRISYHDDWLIEHFSCCNQLLRRLHKAQVRCRARNVEVSLETLAKDA